MGLFSFLTISCLLSAVAGNLPPAFIKDMNLAVISENTPVGTSVYRLQGADPEGSIVNFGITGTNKLGVNRQTGVVRIIAPIDREENDTLNFFVSIEDIVGSGNENNIVKVPVSVIVLDKNDNFPQFTKKLYETKLAEDAPKETVVFDSITVTDEDQVGDALSITCEDDPQSDQRSCEKFKIVIDNPSSTRSVAQVSLGKQLDFAEEEIIKFNLRASDGMLNTSVPVIITIEDVQNSPPVFTGSQTGIVHEDAPIGSLIMTLKADDGDRGNPRPIVYSLESNPENFFSLDSKTGQLKTAKKIDREVSSISNGVVPVKVKASETEHGKILSGADSEASTIISITIRDINDEPPTFNKHEYTVYIDENVPNGTPLPNMDMVVEDTDVGSNSVFGISLLDSSGIFSVEPPIATGSSSVSIRVAKGPLDYENPNQRKFIVLVVAKESFTNPQLSSTATVTVNIADANDNQPSFDRESYSASVMETAVPGTVVTSIKATDLDEGAFGQSGVIYTLFGNGADKFQVHATTGVITVAPCPTPGRDNCLDYETRPTYFLSFQATDNKGDGQTSVVPLTISLADSNDNSPKFLQKTYETIIDEGDTEFVPLLQVQAKDPDVTSNLQYSIVSGNAIDLLTINHVTGIIRITDQLNGLDVSGLNTDLIILTVQASDGGDGLDTATVKINVRDANNNVPIFDSPAYNAEIIEGSNAGTIVEQVAAADADTGVNGQITYRINKGSYDHFEITPDSGIITVSNTTKLDYDRRSLYNVEVYAVDGGSPINTGSATVNIRILNSNDKAPYFTPSTQRAQISEGAEPGMLFYTLKGRDPDVDSEGSLKFGIIEPITAVDKDGHQIQSMESGFKDYFKVDKDTGDVRVATMLNRDLVAIVTIPVTVTDVNAIPPQTGTGTLVVTIIDVNDHAPVFSPPWTVQNPVINFTVVEEQPVGNVVYTFAATDVDSNIDQFMIEPKNEYFKIDNSSGVLMIKNRMDYEAIQKLSFRVIVTDKGVPQLTSTATVNVEIININDKDPMFSQESYSAKIQENSVKGTPVTVVAATDADKGNYGEIKYELIGEYENSFSIDQEGMIRVKSANDLDREQAKMVTLQVVATDQGQDLQTRRSISVPVYITLLDENDNAPKFTEKQYQTSIVENIPTVPPSPILQVTAHDPDDGENAKVMYKIVQGNQLGIFYIHPSSGIVSPVKSLQGRGVKQYRLTIEARDLSGEGSNFDETMVYINVLDINQDKPEFVFPTANTTIKVKENQTLAETAIMTVTAVDMDFGENGRISYYLKVANKNVKATDTFEINPKTGDLKTIVVLDREIKSRYELVMVARDHGSPVPFETLRFVTIEVEDVDDNLPQFTRTQSTDPYMFEVEENGPAGFFIGQVKATDADINQNARIYYFIIGGNQDGIFYIDKIAGTIRANSSLDREKHDHYDLVIKATNDANYDVFERKANIKTRDVAFDRMDNTLALVRVNIGNVNDNEPVFVDTPYLAGVKHSEQVGHLVTVVKATDPDVKGNGLLKYFIGASELFKPGQQVSLGSIHPSPFNISADGRIVLATLLTPFNQNRFEVTVVAQEAVSPFRETKEIVKIWVYEANQLIRVILAQPPEEIINIQDDLVRVLSNATAGIVVVDDIKYHVTSKNMIDKKWTDMYIHVVSLENDEIVPIPIVLESLDQNFDFLRSQHQTFHIKNVLPARVQEKENEFDPTLAALIALLIVLFVGLITLLVVCRCVKYWFSSKVNRALVKNEEFAEVTGGNTTENPLWLDQKLKLYEEQELSMHVFNDQEQAAAAAAAARHGSLTSLNTTDGANMSFGDETGSAVYATLDKSAQRRGSIDQDSRESTIDRMKMKGITFPTANIKSGFDTTGSRDGYASIGGSRYANVPTTQPLTNDNTYHELSAASSGGAKLQDGSGPSSFCNGTLDRPHINKSDLNLDKTGSTLSLSNEGEPVLVANLM